MTLPGVKPLLLPANYLPVPTTELGQTGRYAVCACGQSFRHPGERGRLPKLGPCCRAEQTSKVARTPRVSKSPRRRAVHYAPSDLLKRLAAPGVAVVTFPGGVTLFVGREHYQGDTLADAMRAHDDAALAPPSTASAL